MSGTEEKMSKEQYALQVAPVAKQTRIWPSPCQPEICSTYGRQNAKLFRGSASGQLTRPPDRLPQPVAAQLPPRCCPRQLRASHSLL